MSEDAGLVVRLAGDEREAAEGWLRRAVEQNAAARLWQRDATLWGPAGAPELADRLGWLDAPEISQSQVAEIERFAQSCRRDGLEDVVVLGMGGSSLAPEVFRRSVDAAGGADRAGLRLHVLDSVDPAAVRELEGTISLERALFLVSTKSGGTVETLSLAHHFLERMGECVGPGAAGANFAAITDPASSLLELAEDRGFRHVFLGDPETGGRYSALSVFGTVPMVLAGADLDSLLTAAARGRRLCAPERTGADNAGLRLGTTLGALAVAGRDKLSVGIDEPLAGLGLWLEQLVAESTGKAGRGIVPVLDEPLGTLDKLPEDRVYLAIGGENGAGAGRAAALAESSQPALFLPAHDVVDLGWLFFVTEFATAIAGWVLGVNPFDQPNVQDSKTRTRAVLERGAVESDGAAGRSGSDAETVRALLEGLEAPEYLALLAYAAPSPELDRAAIRLRTAIARSTDAAVTFGLGPRYLHSTGQLHKGGPPRGRFLQLVRAAPERDLAVPGATYGFAELLRAQADGDLEALRDTGRPVARIALHGDPAGDLEALALALEGGA